MGCFIGAHNVPNRGRVESPWVMPPRRDGEPGKGLEELADITRGDWSFLRIRRGGANGTGGSTKETIAHQIDDRSDPVKP